MLVQIFVLFLLGSSLGWTKICWCSWPHDFDVPSRCISFPRVQKYFTAPSGNWWTLCKFSSIFWNEAHWHSGQLEIPWSTWNSPKINGNLLAPGRRNVNSIISFPCFSKMYWSSFLLYYSDFLCKSVFEGLCQYLPSPEFFQATNLVSKKKGPRCGATPFLRWYTMPEVLLMAEIRQTHQLRLVVEIPLLRGLYTFIPGGCFG